MGTGGRVGRSVAALALAAGAACGGPGGGGDGDGGGPGGAGGDAPVRASIQESTLFATQRAFGLTLAPATDRDVRVGAIQLRSPLFAEVEPQVRDARVRASDRAVVVPLRYGEAMCDDGGDDDGAGAADAEAPVLATDVDGEDVRIPLDQRPADLLAGIHAAECASAAVLEDVELRLGDEWVPTAPRALAGTLEVSRRHPGVEATVAPLEGNVIFGVATGAGDPWLAVDDAAPAATGTVEVTAARCDPHALIEYKRTFVFTARVAVGDAEPVLVDVEAEGAARAALESLLASCLG